jgi:cytochrome oxidase assembly protein ShyY1
MSLFVLALVTVFLLLGRWQLNRAHAQSLEDGRRDAALSAAPVDVAALLAPDRPLAVDEEWRAVTATGTYDAAHQVLVRNRSMDTTNGYLVAVPLQTADGDLLVVRGWIPAGATAEGPADVPAVPTGTVTVTGRLRLPEPAGSTADLPAGQVERLVPSQVAELTGRPTYDGWLSMTAEEPQPAGAAALRTLPSDGDTGWRWPISHTAYAVQWFMFCVIAVVGWFVLLRRDVRDGPAPGDGDGAVAQQSDQTPAPRP